MSSPAPNTPAETQVPATTPVVETPASVVEATPAAAVPAANLVGENSGPDGPSLPSGVDARNGTCSDEVYRVRVLTLYFVSERQLSQGLARLGWGNSADEAIECES